jgi:hypothetical protein
LATRGTPKADPWGLNLTFDGQSPSNAVPSWLVVDQGIGVTTPEAASAFSSQALSEAWSGSLVYSFDGFSVKLDDFNIFVADQTGYDRVSPFIESANSRDDAVGKLTLNVTVVPAPDSLPLFATGLAMLGWFGWRDGAKLLALESGHGSRQVSGLLSANTRHEQDEVA